MSGNVLDMNPSPVDKRRTVALRVLLALAVVGVCALVAVGVAVSVTAPQHSSAQRPLRLGGSLETSRANRNLINRKSYGNAELARVQASFDIDGFKEAATRGLHHSFVFDLPGLDEPLEISTLKWAPSLGSSKAWTGHIEGASSNQRVKIIFAGDAMIGTIRLDNHLWQISGDRHDVVVTQLNKAAPEFRRAVETSNQTFTERRERSRRDLNAAPRTMGTVIPSKRLEYSKVPIPNPRFEAAKASGKTRSENGIAGRNSYYKMRILFVLNYNSLNNCGATAYAHASNVYESFIDSWKDAMNMPEPEFLWICYKYWTSSQPNDLASLVAARVALETSTEVQKQRRELGADLVLGIQDMGSTLGGSASGRVSPDSNGLDVNPSIYAAFSVMNSDTVWVDDFTGPHEFGHLFNMRHDRITHASAGTCSTEDIPENRRCNWGVNANSGSGPTKKISLMAYKWNSGITHLMKAVQCDWSPKPLTAADWGSVYAPVYSGYSYTGISFGSTSCTASSLSHYNRYNFESLWNAASLYYPRLPFTCPTNNKGCKRDWTPLTSSQQQYGNLAWTLMGPSFAGEYYVSQFVNYDTSSCINLEQRTDWTVQGRTATKGKSGQKWTIAANPIHSELPVPADGYVGSTPFTFTSKVSNGKLRMVPDYDGAYPEYSLAVAYQYGPTADTDLNTWEKHDYGIGNMYIWCLPPPEQEFCLIVSAADRLLERWQGSGTNNPFFSYVLVNENQVWVLQKTSKSSFYWE